MKTLTLDIPTNIKTSISISDEDSDKLEEYSKKKNKSKGEIIIKILNDGLKRSDRKILDLVEDSGFKRELKDEVIKTLLDFLGTHNLSDYIREELKKRVNRDEKTIST